MSSKKCSFFPFVHKNFKSVQWKTRFLKEKWNFSDNVSASHTLKYMAQNLPGAHTSHPRLFTHIMLLRWLSKPFATGCVKEMSSAFNAVSGVTPAKTFSPGAALTHWKKCFWNPWAKDMVWSQMTADRRFLKVGHWNHEEKRKNKRIWSFRLCNLELIWQIRQKL